jgi:hypothetical protein
MALLHDFLSSAVSVAMEQSATNDKHRKTMGPVVITLRVIIPQVWYFVA